MTTKKEPIGLRLLTNAEVGRLAMLVGGRVSSIRWSAEKRAVELEVRSDLGEARTVTVREAAE